MYLLSALVPDAGAATAAVQSASHARQFVRRRNRAAGALEQQSPGVGNDIAIPQEIEEETRHAAGHHKRLRRYEWRATIEGPASPRPIKTGSEADGWFGHEIYIDTGASRGALPTIVGDGEVQRQSALELSPAGFTILRWPVMFLSDTG